MRPSGFTPAFSFIPKPVIIPPMQHSPPMTLPPAAFVRLSASFPPFFLDADHCVFGKTDRQFARHPNKVSTVSNNRIGSTLSRQATRAHTVRPASVCKRAQPIPPLTKSSTPSLHKPSSYQSLVRPVPVVGTHTTNHRYTPYQRLVAFSSTINQGLTYHPSACICRFRAVVNMVLYPPARHRTQRP